MKREKRMRRKEKEAKFKNVSTWLRAKKEKHRKEEAMSLNREFSGSLN